MYIVEYEQTYIHIIISLYIYTGRYTCKLCFDLPQNEPLQERAAPQVAVLPKRPVPDFSDESASEEAPPVDFTSYKG